MAAKLRFRLVKFERALALQILEQSDKFRGDYDAANGFRISTISCPQLSRSERRLFLRGTSTSSNFDLATETFLTDDHRDAFAAQMLEALREWAVKAPCFAGEFPPESEDGEYVL